MSRRFLTLPLVGVVLAAALLGAHCNSSAPAAAAAGPLGTKAPEKVAAAADVPGSADGAAAPNDGLSEQEAQKLIPGIDTSMLTPRQRADLSELASDTFCPCASTTVAACLRTNTACHAAVRLTEFAKQMFIDGQTPAGALLRVETYYGSFGKERRRDVAPDGPSKGADLGRVIIVEFSDFQCPACKAAHPQLGELVHKYPADVKVVFRNFPLPRHEHSQAAAAMGVYAAEKGKFWPVADRLFERQENLTDDTLNGIAKEVGLDPGEMNKAIFTDPKYKQKVADDLATGTDLQVNSTPTLYVNGRQLILPATLKYLSWTVEDELEWLANGGSWTKK